ncbi:uncharacterized protein FOMMEDRAFT_152630 [Fomitiporia mediterranea MF3/22]|uniref:uncharacterized protein n=1 Tax=Fomitiporia mediterranea (strain MF3/22) TaxID=694068 RepID=UPI0004409708|nr:uncharacterized protein FOMMEDRAFT_152630 [Fomitiporia mediterranea MF3/22]EJD05333.1 hypothetical protein FOMMEDRAFT_152630 [Fomitiporia mediterranea MF3/22]
MANANSTSIKYAAIKCDLRTPQFPGLRAYHCTHAFLATSICNCVSLPLHAELEAAARASSLRLFVKWSTGTESAHFYDVRNTRPNADNGGRTEARHAYKPNRKPERRLQPLTNNAPADSFTQKSKASVTTETDNVHVPDRSGGRTPSPTPSETAFLNNNRLIDWHRMKTWQYWFERNKLVNYVMFVMSIALVVLGARYNKKIVHALNPTARHLRDMSAGWLIPIAILFVIAFPPLMGQELAYILIGIIWGFWIGIGVTAAGTILGEICSFLAFRYCCMVRASKFEEKHIRYACFAKVVRAGSFKIALLTRYTVIPGHLFTPIFTTCGMNFFLFVLAVLLSLPRQAAFIYIGDVLEKVEAGNERQLDRILSGVVVFVLVTITIAVMLYIRRLMHRVKHDVVYARRMTRAESSQAALDRA